MINLQRLLALAILFTVTINVYGQVDNTRKTYSLFKPLPRALMREDMETDRPDITETPYTVEAGHIQYEADLVNYERQRSTESLKQTWLINQANIKVGLLKNTSLQLVVQTYGKDITKDLVTMDKQTNQGFGDITVRVKQNLYGNYNGNFSIAVMPYIKFPTNRYADNKSYEEGLIVPVSFKLLHDWKIGLQVEGDRLKDDEEEGMHTELLQTLVLSHVLFKKLEVMGETYYTYNFKDHQIRNFVNAALQLEISPDVKVDAGINYGLQHEAKKNYFAGIAFRY
ncbi:transporter [Mucilaginibacter antarcticus]|uniref:Transporter n=1 Tax=Mucilaginibacter antarcticus TaxID=1855725 RepID=A0ABW5XQW0_9SPHI